jgi:hypothetical protein
MMSGWNLLVIGPFLSMEVLCGFSKMIEMLASLENGRGN